MKYYLLIALSLTVSLVTAKEPKLEDFAQSIREFSAAAYHEILVDNKENLLMSPFSVETILALTQAGAVGTTGEEIRSTLFLPETEEKTDALIKIALPTFTTDQYILKTANKIYVEDKFAIKENFKEIAADVYQAGFENVEFTQNFETANKINEWIEEQTNHKIHDLITPDELNALTKIVLVNTLYFAANWTTPFQPILTQKADFYSPNNKIIKSDLMYVESAELNFYENEELDAKFLEIPFIGDNAVMTFILPNKKEGIAILEKQPRHVLNSPKYQKEFVQVSLPKFRIESTINFNNILENMGIHAAFDRSIADFSGIAGNPGEISISKVTQKTFVDVNEFGVEAAAATDVVGPDSLAPPPTKFFFADHPFMFHIKINDIILFEGRVLEPKYD